MEQFLEVSSKLLLGFSSSVLMFLLTLIIALPLGLLLSFCTISRFAPLRVIFKVIVWILRGTPLMLQIFVIFYLPGLLDLFVWPTVNTGWVWFDKTITTRFIAALVAFSINYAAYFSEIYRSRKLYIRAGYFVLRQNVYASGLNMAAVLRGRVLSYIRGHFNRYF